MAVQKHGVGNWRVIADEVGVSSCSPKSCCQRWKSKHQPNLITEPFCDLEDAIIIAALQVGLWELPSSKLHTSMVSGCAALEVQAPAQPRHRALLGPGGCQHHCALQVALNSSCSGRTGISAFNWSSVALTCHRSSCSPHPCAFRPVPKASRRSQQALYPWHPTCTFSGWREHKASAAGHEDPPLK